MLRALRNDIAQYNEEDKEEALEQSGWKLVHGLVLRPPENVFWYSLSLSLPLSLSLAFPAFPASFSSVFECF